MSATIYLVKSSNRAALVASPYVTKVGKPSTITDMFIVKANCGVDDLMDIEGVTAVELDDQAVVLSVDQPSPPPWALGWISNTGGSYKNDKTGAGVDIYILDTGVRDTHEDLAGRVRTLYSFDGQPYSMTGDNDPSHGTAVAGCAAGTIHGTAKGATIVNVRSSFFNSDILKCLDVILKDHLDKPDNVPSILNFSGATISSIIGEAFARLTQYGVVVVAAAGNNSGSEPMQPAKQGFIVAVGAINQWGDPAWFTNRKCEIYAPGQDITTASVFSDTSTTVISGTSFACPYYCGLLACLLEGSDKFNTQIQVDNFTFQMRMQIMDRNRIPFFDNGGYLIQTASSRGLGGVYYRSPSAGFTDADVAEFCNANINQPQFIADGARDYNVSLSRLVRSLGFDAETINGYFADAGVTPWWSATAV